MRKRALCIAALAAALLVGCGAGGTSDPGTTTGREASGYVFGPLRGAARSRAMADQQTPLSGLTINAYLLPGNGSILATATTDYLGRFSFSSSTSNALPANKSILLLATGAGRVLSAVINTDAATQTRTLTEATHIATLGIRDGEGAAVTDARIALFEVAARQALDTALTGAPNADYSQSGQQTAAAAVADSARSLVTHGSVTANSAPLLSNVTVTPAQLTYTGGTVRIDADVSDRDSDPVTVTALLFTQAGAAPTVLALSVASGHAVGNLSLAANNTAASKQYQLVLVADDGITPPVPQVSRTVTVLPEGKVKLDILAETLYDEAASRAVSLSELLDRMRPRVVRGGPTRAGRQVNANQSIRGATVTVDDAVGVSGATGSNGLLLLEVPMSAIADGVLGMRASIDNRVTYHQYLVMPQGVSLQAGDTVEVNLVLAPQTDWITFAANANVAGTNFAKVPILACFNVRSGISLTGVTPAGTRYRAIDTTSRTDDGDYFAAGFNAGTATLSGVFTDPSDAVLSYAFGPAQLALTAGEVGAMSALLPPR